MDKDLHDLASEDTSLHQENRKNNTWCGPCPGYPDKCSCGTDGFVVFLDAYDGIGGFSCRGCWDSKNPPIRPDKPRLGDMIDYYRHFKDMSFVSAKQAKEEYLDEAVDAAIRRVERVTKKKQQAKNVPPPEQWQTQKDGYVQQAIKRLRTAEAKPVLDYLLQRGFIDETIIKCKFGAIHSSDVSKLYLGYIEEGYETWFVVIPYYIDGQLWQVEMRDIRPDCDIRYRQWPNSSNGLYLADCLDRKLPTIIVEGAFDAAIIAQEAGDLVNVVATGSTQGAQISLWVMRLSRMPICFLAQDNEDKGDEGVTYWAERLARKSPMRWRPMGAKDANAMHLRKHGFVRTWVEMAVESWQEALAVAETGAPAEVSDLASVVGDDAATPETEEEETASSELEESDYCACGVSVVEDESAGGYDSDTCKYVCSQCHTKQLQRLQVEEWTNIASRTLSDWRIEVIPTSEIRAMMQGAVSSFSASREEKPLPAKPGEYVPVSLAPLPRLRCPHLVIYQTRDKEKPSQFLMKQKKCTGKPGASGWCAEHEKVARFLDIGAKLGYPELKAGDRIVQQGVIGWEDAATRLLVQVEILKGRKSVKTKDLYTRIMPTLERRVKLLQSA